MRWRVICLVIIITPFFVNSFWSHLIYQKYVEQQRELTQLQSQFSMLEEKYQEIENGFKELTEPLSPPEIIERIGNLELRGFLQKMGCTNILLGDFEYELTTVEEIERFLEWDQTDKLIYDLQTFDCDDFSLRLAGIITMPGWSNIAFGEAWFGDYAFNIFVTKENGNLVLYKVDPRTDEIQKIIEPLPSASPTLFGFIKIN